MSADSLTCKLLDTEDDSSTTKDQVENESVKSDCLKTTRACSLIIGLIVGAFIQASTLGLNFLIGAYGTGTPSMKTYTTLTVAWCLVASSLGVAVLLFLRSLVVTTFYVTADNESGVIAEAKEDFMIQVIDKMERFFAMGSLAGVGLAWCVTDILLDLKAHLMHSSLTFIVALVWYSIV